MSVHDFRWLETPNFATLPDSSTLTKGTQPMPTHFVNSSHMTLEPSKDPTPNFTVSSYEKFMVFMVKDAELFRITESGDVFVRGKLATSDLEVYQAFKLWIQHAQTAQAPDASSSPAPASP